MIVKNYVTSSIVIIALSLAFSSAARGASEDVIKTANKEGHLLLYGGAMLQHMTLLSENFNRLHPGIKVNYLRKSGSALFELIIRELRAKTYNADAYVPITIDQAIYLAERNLLPRYASPERASIPPFVIAMAHNAPHPAAVKLFIDFLLSKEAQKFMQENIFRQSPRVDVEPGAISSS